MLNFTLGPVMTWPNILEVGSEQVPYFRTSEFSNIIFENERLLQKFVNASEDSKTIFITGSGTASMEVAVMNLLLPNDKVLVINGGGFGQRFSELCLLHGLNYVELKLEPGCNVTPELLNKYANEGITALLVNVHETSTGVLYDMKIISDFCRNNNIFMIADAISAFLADPIDMQEMNMGAIIIASQKALACAPGISAIVLSRDALERIERSSVKVMYFDLKNAIKNAERGQTPFTPAVSVLLQINKRLNEIDMNGGAEVEIERVKNVATDFRKKINGLPFSFFAKSMSNATTALQTNNISAYDVFTILKDEYNIWVCPNGGDLAKSVFRVGHIGNITFEDNNKLIEAFMDMNRRNIF